METKPLLDKISAASRTVSEVKEEESEKRERRIRETKSVEEAINGGCVCFELQTWFKQRKMGNSR